MNQLQAVIVDDEQDSVKLLQLMLQRHCPDIDCISAFTNSQDALSFLKLNRPKLLFLDIEMPLLNGFELLKQLMPIDFSVIFVTAYHNYAIKAFRYSALDYLVKPVEPEELIAAVSKVQSRPLVPLNEQLAISHQVLVNKKTVNRVAIPSATGISFFNFDEIMYIEADNNYSRLHMNDGSRQIVSKTMKDIQAIFETSHFMRVHRQYMVNLNKVKSFHKTDSIIVMENNTELPIARINKEEFLERFNRL
jgi:two-component system LytT family response regulator